ncbi:MAG: branched-chain amino acid ABC transporter permease [Candidatus Promineifilaceae bacterium]|nr:branched-chain amino acid ABC transporter permease [Candidatus Promineifilaceae bacterium]
MFDWKRWLAPVILLIVIIVLPLVYDDDRILTLAVLTFVIAGLAASWNIVGGFAGQISLGHAAFFGIGSLVTRQLWLGGLPLAVSIIAALLATAAAALLIGYPALRLRGIYFSIGTLALAVAIRITVDNVFPGISALPVADLRDYSLVPRYYLSFGTLLLTIIVSIYLTHSRLGLGMMAVREDEDAARSIGVNIFRYKLAAFMISASLAGLIGSSFAFFHVSYYPSLPFVAEWTFDAIIVTFIGGIGTVAGPLIGAVFFVLVRDVLATNFVHIHLIVFGAIFILVVLLLPGGMMEAWDRFKIWRGRSSKEATISPTPDLSNDS